MALCGNGSWLQFPIFHARLGLQSADSVFILSGFGRGIGIGVGESSVWHAVVDYAGVGRTFAVFSIFCG